MEAGCFELVALCSLREAGKKRAFAMSSWPLHREERNMTPPQGPLPRQLLERQGLPAAGAAAASPVSRIGAM